MDIRIEAAPLSDIQDLRNISLRENNFQFVHDKCHGAGWADTYRFSIGQEPVGYGSVWGKDDRAARDTIFEYYILRPYRHLASRIFPPFSKLSQTAFMECQTNNALQTEVFFENVRNIEAEAILFDDRIQTDLSIPGSVFRKNPESNDPEYVLEHQGQRAAWGGFVTNYNFPFIDMYYEVDEEFRRKGFGSLITQELKKEAYRLKRVPSARCNPGNTASKATLVKAGMRVCGHMLMGELAG